MLVVEVHVDFHPKAKRQTLNKLLGLGNILFVGVKLNLSQQLDIDLRRDLILIQNLIKNFNLLGMLVVGRILVCDDGC